ncbi:HlyD family secretion protein [Acidocella aminolytica]|jgi:membrane fusion protein (multidrug efflux system)|uniref:Multidrug resistance efflux pump HlyD n=2 Tax=Acidocella TaxID=50709 RepID=A0A0D6PHY8_9PROT|nr:HlyD family secretion protein [Acidocella aminolytica]GAN80818.1 multidrug resistance efflux pump HlyD [Acidocella aminolytica 101 = DSM 11237]GBQ36358.1 multidrug resistance efflux pump [Acidocella aminolytica 101 = DSM 11237]SHE32665.1 membrane fusion protein, multidrug efflux system [Acidocella aminolytica 101 = DSM 11237]
MVGAGFVFAVLALGGWLIHYILIGQYLVSTDDAYLAADSSLVASKISGYVTKVAVLENEPVTKGQLLVQIDPRDYENAVKVAQAGLASAQAELVNDQAQLSLQASKIAAAMASVEGDKARLTFAEQNQRRYATLSAKGASPVQSADQADTDLRTARANLAADRATEQAAQRQVDVLNAQLAGAKAAVTRAQAQLAQAQLNLEHTAIRAPFDGVVGNKTVATGDYLQPGTQIMAVVPLSKVYVLANYKETQITHIRPGQSVKIHVDGFPNLKVRGHVDSIYPASGQEFALLPPDNATGNFTKIVQRVPVKILIDLTPQEVGKLRPGMSVEPEIDTRSGK